MNQMEFREDLALNNIAAQGIQPFVVGADIKVPSRPNSAVRRKKVRVKRGGSAAQSKHSLKVA